MDYQPRPIDTASVLLPAEIRELTERLAENAHEIWAAQRLKDGWTYGPRRDDQRKEHPCLIPYAELPDSEKQYDRNAAMESLKAIIAQGYQITPPQDANAQGETDTAESDLSQPVKELLAHFKANEKTKRELAVILEAWRQRRAGDAAWQDSAEPYRYLGQRLLKLGSAPVAHVVATGALEHEVPGADGTTQRPWATDVELRLIDGLSLARMASPEPAQRVLGQLHDELHMDQDRPLDAAEKRVWEETLGMLGRTYKDQAMLAGDSAEQQQLWQKSAELYARAYRLTGGYWTGINVAALARLSGDDQRARSVAEQVRRECLEELERLLQKQAAGEAADVYWLLATLGEAALVLGDLEEAGQYYMDAHRSAPNRFGDLNATRRHARWLLAHGGHDAALLDRWLPIPRVAVFAGHMIDQPDRPRERFPERLASDVKAALLQWLRQHNARIGFSSAACGADLLFQEALHELDGQGYVVLPYDDRDFETASVRIFGDGRDDEWSRRYRSVITDATQVVTASPQKMQTGGISYDYANLVLHGLATVQAAELETGLVALAVWDGKPGDGAGGTASVIARWHGLQVPVSYVNLSRLPKEASGPLPVVTLSELPRRIYRGARRKEADTRVMSLLFGDAVNFSKLTEEQVPRFVQHFLGPIADLLKEKYGDANRVRNTWGDGLYLVFDNVHDAGCCALDICEFVNEHREQQRWAPLGLPAELNIRLALHAGPVFGCRDPVTRQKNYTGTHVSRAARLEPKTPHGQVYASQAFAALCAVDRVTDFQCVYVKQLEWAKHYGTFPTYVVRRTHP